MPNRILRDVCDSEKLNAVSVQAERLFYRLIQKVDDFGRLTSSARVLRPMLFPLQLDTVREADLQRWLAELDEVQVHGEPAGLIRLYEVDGRGYLCIVKWKQFVRAKESKYPPPPDEVQSQCACNADEAHPRSKTTTKTESYSETTTGVVGVDGEGGDEMDTQVRAFIRQHKFLLYDAKTHGNCRKLVEMAGWSEARRLIDQGVSQRKPFPVGWALGVARNGEIEKAQKEAADNKPRRQIKDVKYAS